MAISEDAEYAIKQKQQAECLFTHEQVGNAIRRVAKEINESCESKELIVLTILNGAIVFAGSLVPHLNMPLRLDYIHASRYENSREGRTLKIHAQAHLNFHNQNILIVDDILDKGVTLAAVREYCLEKGAREVLSAVLLEKQIGKNNIRSRTFCADFIGLQIPNVFVVGMGMDAEGYLRNMAGIYSLS